MTINENLTEFAGKPVRDYDPSKGLKDPASTSYRIRLDWDAHEEGLRITDLLSKFLQEPGAREVESLVIGAWDFESSENSSGIVELIAAAKDTLSGLRALFLGDIVCEEQEVSWIQQSDISPLFLTLPELRQLRVRGADGLEVGAISHDKLEHLAFESGGLPSRIVGAVVNAHLPELTHLELWLGEENYGYDGSVNQLDPIIVGDCFPKLRYLGLKNSEEQDKIAKRVAKSPILERLEVLDLSMGTLTDEGAKALLHSPSLGNLKKLDIHHHFVSDEVVDKLKKAVPNLDASEVQEEEDDGDGDVWRFIAVSE